MPACLHLLRQAGHGELQLVLHLHLRDVRIGAAAKGQRRGRLPGVVADRGQVEQVVKAFMCCSMTCTTVSCTVVAEAPG